MMTKLIIMDTHSPITKRVYNRRYKEKNETSNNVFQKNRTGRVDGWTAAAKHEIKDSQPSLMRSLNMWAAAKYSGGEVRDLGGGGAIESAGGYDEVFGNFKNVN